MSARNTLWSSLRELFDNRTPRRRRTRGKRRSESFLAQFDGGDSLSRSPLANTSLCGFDTLEVRVMLAVTPTDEDSFGFDATTGTITALTGPGGDIVIPATIGGVPVTSIGASAFKFAFGVKTLIIPEGVTSIGDSAFENCVGLTSITLPESLTSIGSFAFKNCGGLPSIALPSALTSLGNSAFQDCRGLTSITLPASLTSIGASAFQGCSGLKSIGIPASLTSIGASAFVGCSGLTSITLPTNLASIGASAFAGCGGLTSITLPASLTSIGNSAFSSCNGLKSVTLLPGFMSTGSSVFANCKGLTSITLPTGLTSIGNEWFSGCSGLTSIAFPASLTSINASAFSGCSGLTSITFPTSLKIIGTSAFQGCSGLTSSISLPASLTSLGDAAFLGCTGLPSITFPGTLTSIGTSVFEGCSGLTSIRLAEGLASINASAFKGCNSLRSITFPASLTNIGDSAFQGCAGLKSSITLPASLTKIGDYAFDGCSGLPSITFPASLTSIGIRAFQGCSGLKSSITLPASVTNIAEYTFNGCSGLPSIVLSASLKTIGNAAFYGCSGLTRITFPSSLERIGDNAFQNCSGLTGVTFPASLASISIGTYAFASCSGLKSITLPVGLKSVSEGAFISCSGLTSITLPAGITSIGHYAFYGCSGLTSVTLPAGLKSIGGWSFRDCSGLRSIYFLGDPPNSIDPREEWTSLGRVETRRSFEGVSGTVYCLPGTFGWTTTLGGLDTSLFTVAPVEPTDVSGTTGNGQVLLSWTAPSSNGGSTITDYTIQYSSNGGTSWTAVTHSASTATTATVTGLTNGTSYLLRVAAVNRVGTGSFATTSTAVTPATIPGVPSSVIGIIGNNQVSLSWTATADNGGLTITDYTIRYSSNGGTSWTTFPHSASAATAATVTELTGGTSYVFQVAAVNAVGTSNWSSSSSAVVPRAVPAVPTSVIGTVGNSQVLLSWTAPTNNGSSAITNYTIQYSSDGGTTWSTFSRAASTATRATVAGLTNGTSYWFQVAAVNVAGTSNWSMSSAALTPCIIPGVPSSIIGVGGDSQVSLNWTPPSSDGGSAITDYTIQYSGNDGVSWSTFSHSASAATEATVTGLINGSSYRFQVAAVNAAGTGSWSSTSAAVTPRTVPAVPASISSTAGNGRVSLSWAVPASIGGSAITDYTIQYSSNGGTNWTTFPHTASIATAATVTGLTNGTSYVFQIAAVNGVGTGGYSSSPPAVTPRTVPTVPTSLTGTAANGQVSLSWIAPSSNGGSAITDYAIRYVNSGGIRWFTVPRTASTASAATVTGLTNGTAYEFQVAAVNGAGAGVWSSFSPIVTPRTTPAVPTSVAGTAGNGQVLLNWAAPSSNGGSTITDYTIQYSRNGGTSWSTFAHSPSTATAATVTGLTNGTSYLFQVAAVNIVGTSSQSMSSAAVTPRTIPGVPSSIVGVIGDRQVALNWTAPDDNGGGAITDYTVQYSSDAGSSWSTFPHSASAATAATVTGLTSGTSYVFQVAAVNSAGAGSWSTNSAAVVPLSVPTEPISVIGTAGNSRGLLSWTAPADNGGAAITDYTIQYSSDSGSSWSTFPHAVSTATAATVTGLTNGTSYLFQVAAVNKVGAGSWSGDPSAVTPRTLPTLPTSVTGTAGNGQLSLSWTAPSSNGGSEITDYTIRYSSNGGTNWSTFPHSESTATAATVTGLTNGTSYVVQVAAVNIAGTGGWSSNSSAVTPRTVPAVPTSVTGAAGNGQVSLGWIAPSSNGGSAITNYTIQYSSDGGTSWSTFPRSASTATAAMVTGLTNGTSYVFQVAAVNMAGTGGWSNNSSNVTPRTVPAVPTSAIGTAGNGQVSLSWTAPSSNGGSAMTDYTIQYSSDGGIGWSTFSHSASTATTATVTGLTNGTRYLFRVAAVNVAGTGGWSSNSSNVTPRTVPAVPTSVNGAGDNGQVLLNWTAPADNGGTVITDYTIQYSGNGGSNWTTFPHSASTTTTATVTGLTNGTAYLFQVAAVNGVGAGNWSSNPSTVSPRTVPAVPISVTGTAGNGNVLLNWAAPANNGGSVITDYAVQYSSNGGSSWTTFQHSASRETTARVTGLNNGTNYLFQVGAVNAAGTGNWSSSSVAITPRTIPRAPSNIISAVGDSQVSLSWTAPSTNSGSAITDYVVQYSNDGGSSWTNVPHSASTATTAIVTGLTNGTGYRFRTAAVNAAGTGSWSSSSPSATPRTLPAVPTSVTGTAGNGRISLNWTAPADNGGGVITNYTIRYSSDGGSSWTTFPRSASKATSATVTGLTNGTSYLFQVAAINGAGAGAFSTSSARVTPLALVFGRV